MKSIILSYHSHNISGSAYHNNDHVALAGDLETVTRAGAEIIPLMDLVRKLFACKAGSREDAGKTYVALSFDDGPLFDWQDFIHPVHGPQRSFFNLMQDFRARHGSAIQPGLSATSFVIASPAARKAMACSPECGYTFLDSDWLGDDWWEDAARTGMLSIGNHSWDHVHPVVPDVALSSPVRGDFSQVASYPDADAQIRQAASYIREKTQGLAVPLFAFPFGHHNDYLTSHYLPEHRTEHGMAAAFTTEGRPINAADSIWRLPRYICGHHWKSAQELLDILVSATHTR